MNIYRPLSKIIKFNRKQINFIKIFSQNLQIIRNLHEQFILK